MSDVKNGYNSAHSVEDHTNFALIVLQQFGQEVNEDNPTVAMNSTP